MGGLSGHMCHVHEDNALTFGEVKAILHLASKGKLASVTEKLDGQNTFFTFNPLLGLRFARNGGHIKTGGIDAYDINIRWSDKPLVAEAFAKAYKVLSVALDALSARDRQVIFNNGTIWYSAEIIGRINPNVIRYDGDAVVFHESGTVYDDNGKPLDIDTGSNFASLINNVNRMQNAILETGWKVMGPVSTQLTKLDNIQLLDSALTALNSFMFQWDMDNEDTLNDAFLEYLIAEHLLDLAADDDTKLYVAELVSDFENTLTSKKPYLTSLIEQGALNKDQYKLVTDLIKNGPNLYTRFVEPVRDTIREFSVGMLHDMQSCLITNSVQEVQRLRMAVESAIEQIELLRTDREKDMMKKELGRLKALSNISSSMEGIVFKYSDKVYKFTGAFAPVNQILGLEKYGR